MSGSVEIQQIVEYLRSPPFNRVDLGLVDFSKKSPIELLQVVNDVFSEIDSSQKKDIREEQKEQTAIRMLEFVTVLGYKIEGDIGQFGDSFMRGNPLVLYPFLFWVLSNFEKNKLRGYLSRYLRPFSIPEEHFADAQIVNMYQQYQIRQGEFKEAHIAIEDKRKTAMNPKNLQQEVTQLENEKEQLHNKLEKLRSKISDDPEYRNVNFEEMLTITNQLRQEQEIEAKLYQDLQEQKHRLQRAEFIRNQTARKFQEMNHSDMATMEPEKLVQKLQDEVNQRKEYLERKLELQIKDRESQLKHLSKIASNSSSIHSEFSQDDYHSLQREKHALTEILDELHQRRENSSLANDSKLTFVRDRLVNTEKKKEKLLEQVKELEEEKAENETELKKIQSDLKSLLSTTQESQLLPSGQRKPKTEQEMKEYMQELNKRTLKYKQMKADLENDKQEIGILRHTEQILRSKDEHQQEFNEEQEKLHNVVGLSKVNDNLESISVQKNQLDTNKGETLDEISAIVSQITNQLKERKDKLTPQIKELRTVRLDYEAIESVYKSKKSVYDNILLSFDSERMKLESDLQALKQSMNEEESSYHFLQTLKEITQAKQEQVVKEKQNGGETSKAYEKAIQESEALTKTLRQEKKFLTEKHDSHVVQRQMFSCLRSILKKKLEVTKGGNAGGAGNDVQMQNQQFGGGSGYGQHQQQQQQQSYQQQQQSSNYSSGSSQYFDQLAAESDRLVLEQ